MNPIKKALLTAGLVTGLAATPAQSKFHAEYNIGLRTSAPTPEISLSTGRGTKTDKNLLFQIYGGLGLNHSTKGKDLWFIAPHLGAELIPIYNRICGGFSTELKFWTENTSYDVSEFDPVKYERTTRTIKNKAQEFQIIPSLILYIPISKQNNGVKMKLGASIPLYSTLNKEEAKKQIRFAASIEGTFGNN